MDLMVRMYCGARHGGGDVPCEECRGLIEYASSRVERCPFLDDKPTCAMCTVHCFEKRRRSQMREVMRHSGPRMIFRHPILAVRHTIDGRRRTPMMKERAPPES